MNSCIGEKGGGGFKCLYTGWVKKVWLAAAPGANLYLYCIFQYFSIFLEPLEKKPHRRVAKLQFAPGAANHTFFYPPCKYNILALRDCRLNSKWHSPYCHFFTLKSVKFLTFSQLFINKKFQIENRNILFILEQVDKAKVFCCKSGTWSIF